ncbi:hypothetical protein SAMN04488556_2952 [Halostagnicola kamekurae]|uniref:Uncharacterized protein n=1 Tax=Halostagnicola kamekurae TaxID=619731 RepID=A0A1I6SWA6_9EURY|nr:hypothetical protein SAMN04488556_2952 [Halostagnicola kamekurae]
MLNQRFTATRGCVATYWARSGPMTDPLGLFGVGNGGRVFSSIVVCDPDV